MLHGAAVLVLAELSVLHLGEKTDLTLSKTPKMDSPVKQAGTHHGFTAHFTEGTGTFGLGAGPDVLIELKVERTKYI